MSGKTLGAFLQGLRRFAGSTAGAALDDSQLLERFLRQRDEAAFEVLLWRHGPMVLGVCRRLLRHEQEVEDAFQAAFLTLVRKAGSISRRESLAGWLYQVSHRIALAARAGAVRRARLERAAPAHSASGPDPGPLWRDLRGVLDEEIGRLPEKYRLPVVLCHLEGKSCQEAAAEVGCPVGTLTSRLTRACQQLAGRLSRRGVMLPAGALTAALSAEAATASLPPELVAATMRLLQAGAAGGLTAAGVSGSAITLMEGVVRAMWLTKLKLTAAVVLSLGMLAGGTGWLAYRAQAGGGDGPAAESPRKGTDSRAQRTPPATQCPEMARRELGVKACTSCHTSDPESVHRMWLELGKPVQTGFKEKDERQLKLDVEQARKDLMAVYAKIREDERLAGEEENFEREKAEATIRQREKDLAAQREREQDKIRAAQALVDKLRWRVMERKIEVAAVGGARQNEATADRLRSAAAFLDVERKELAQAQAELQDMERRVQKVEAEYQKQHEDMLVMMKDARDKVRQRTLANEALRVQHQIELEVAKERYREALRAAPRRPVQEAPDLEKRIEQMSRELQELRRELQQRKP
jgi:RNA polymerase sigma factor (sigma-70 family)